VRLANWGDGVVVEKRQRRHLVYSKSRLHTSNRMLVKEYRIPLPLTVEEYRIAHST